MKKWMTGFLCTMTLAALGATGVFAQSYPLMRVNIPFAFEIGDHQLPPGTYVVSESGAAGSLLSVRGINVEVSGIFNTMPAEPNRGIGSDPQLRFHKYGDKYYLSSVWLGSDYMGRQVFKSKHERESMAMTNTPATEVVAAVRQ